MKLSPLYLALLTAFAAPALAQSPATRQLDHVDVSGRRPLPGSAEQLQGNLLETRRAAQTDSARLLQHLPGVSVQAAGGISGLPAIHGLSGDRNRIQIDGMDFIAACPNHMNPPTSYIAPEKVAHITVHSTMTPVSVGGDSIGGSIQLQSAAPFFNDQSSGWTQQGEFSARYRSNGNARSAQGSLTLANAVFSLNAEASLAQADNYRAGSDFRMHTASGRKGHEIARDEVASSAYFTRNQSLSLAVRQDDGYWQLQLGRQDIPFQHYPNQRMDMTGNRQHYGQLSYQASHEWGQLEARLWQENLRHSMGFGPDRQYWYGIPATVPGQDYTVPCTISYQCAGNMPMETESHTRAAQFQLQLPLSKDQLLRLGGQWQRYRLDDWWPPAGRMMWPESFWNIRQGQRLRSSVFAEWEQQLAEGWMLQGGIRYSRISTRSGEVQGYDTDPAPPGSWPMTAADAARFNAHPRHSRDHHLDASMLLRWKAAETLDVELGASWKNRSPNLYERYAWSSWSMAAVMNNFAGDGNGYVGNPDLRPERARLLAMTIDWHSRTPDGWQLRITPWQRRVHDYIDAVPLSDNGRNRFNVLRHANQAARLHGIDLSFDTRLADSAIGIFRLSGSGQWQRSKNLHSGQSLYNTPPANARLTLQHQWHGWENSLELEGARAKRHRSAVRNELPTPGYGLAHLRSSYQWQNWRLDAGIENLFDRLYALPGGGVYVAQGATMAINGIPHGIPLPGAGRNAYIGLKYRF
ncbi:MAG: TonB-dependent receptor [Pseudomonadota bacterium]|nr:TonB-dependent receptor [Pseudomonadota bacterium]